MYRFAGGPGSTGSDFDMNLYGGTWERALSFRTPNMAAFAEELLALARRAAEWRRTVEDILPAIEATSDRDGALRVSRSSLRGYDADTLRVLWPALAARASVVMDRRGTHRAAEFTMKGATGGAIQLSGGIEIVMSREHMLLRRAPREVRA